MGRAEKRRQDKLARKAIRKPEAQPPTNPSISSSSAPMGDFQQLLEDAAQHYAAGRLVVAKRLCEQVLTTQPRQPVALHMMGVIAQHVGQYKVAIDLISKALSIAPDYSEAHHSFGNVLRDLGRRTDALASFENAISINPGYANAHNNLGNLFKELGRPQDAMRSYQQALVIDPDNPQLHNNMGLVLQSLGKQDQAMASYNRAINLWPGFADAYNNLATTLQEIGKLQEAADQFRQALIIDPDYAEVHRNLALIKKHTAHDRDIQAMENVFKKPRISPDQKMHLAFGLGKAFEDIKQYDKAFEFLALGNALKRDSFTYNLDRDGEIFTNIKAVFDRSLFAKYNNTGCPDRAPIFVLGMPRSGTSLVEQILASHRHVHGAGELKTLAQIIMSYFCAQGSVGFPDCMGHLDGADLDQLGADYIKKLKCLSGSPKFITDKMPENYFYIGIIKLALPNAKVIHCKRDPADNGLSLFKSYFPGGGHHYAYELGEIGRYLGFFNNLMDHWHEVIPGFVHDIQYEDLVADQVGQTRALLDFCGLEWDDACLKFYKTDRPVNTVSVEQVRRPIYKSSVQSWKRFEVQLSPMLEALGLP